MIFSAITVLVNFQHSITREVYILGLGSRIWGTEINESIHKIHFINFISDQCCGKKMSKKWE